MYGNNILPMQIGQFELRVFKVERGELLPQKTTECWYCMQIRYYLWKLDNLNNLCVFHFLMVSVLSMQS